MSVHANLSAAVGLFIENGELKLRMPHGCAPAASGPASGSGFLSNLRLLYATLKRFRAVNVHGSLKAGLDGVEKQDLVGGAARGVAPDEWGHAFNLVDMWGLDALFEQVNPLRALALKPRQGLQGRDLYRHLGRLPDYALFDDDHVPFFDRVKGDRQELARTGGEVAGLYCWLARDFQCQFLGHRNLQPAWGRWAVEGHAAAETFARKWHLPPGATLWAAQEWAGTGPTRALLQQVWRRIERATPFRQGDFEAIAQAIEHYLFSGVVSGTSGQIWGIKNFWPVWESLCLCQAFSESGVILTCDFQHFLSDGISPAPNTAEWENFRNKVFHKNGIARRPDLVRRIPAHPGQAPVQSEFYEIVDFKYYRDTNFGGDRPRGNSIKYDDAVESQLQSKSYQALSESKIHMPAKSLKSDCDSIEAYGFLLENHLLRSDPDGATVKLQFWLPAPDGQLLSGEKAIWWSRGDKNAGFHISQRYLCTKSLMRAYAGLQVDGPRYQVPHSS